MTPERWKQVDDLLDAVLEREAQARPRFLDEACGEDAELRAEVASLLAAHERAKDFIETPAFEVAARCVADDAASVAAEAEFPRARKGLRSALSNDVRYVRRVETPATRN